MKLLKRLSEEQRRRNQRRLRRRQKNAARRKERRDHYRKYGYKPAKHKVRIIRTQAPIRLDLEAEDTVTRRQTIDFLRRLQTIPNIHKKHALFVDLANCEFVGLSAALVLTAELEIAQMRNPGMVTGRDPIDPEAASVFDIVQFHRHLKYVTIPEDQMAKPSENLVVKLQSGGLQDSPGTRLPEAAAAISEVLRNCPDIDDVEANMDRIHQALNEGLLNVLQHAYPDEGSRSLRHALDPKEKRWWAIGIVDMVENKLTLFVYDRGVGISSTLRPNLRERLAGYVGKDRDMRAIKAAIDYGRTSRSEGDGGKGLPQMLDLISHFPGSFIIVESGHGLYVVDNSSGENEVSVGTSEDPLPGTLLYWELRLDGREDGGD